MINLSLGFGGFPIIPPDSYQRSLARFTLILAFVVPNVSHTHDKARHNVPGFVVNLLLGLDPGTCSPSRCFIGINRSCFFHRQADVIETVEQAVLFERVDFEVEDFAV